MQSKLASATFYLRDLLNNANQLLDVEIDVSNTFKMPDPRHIDPDFDCEHDATDRRHADCNVLRKGGTNRSPARKRARNGTVSSNKNIDRETGRGKNKSSWSSCAGDGPSFAEREQDGDSTPDGPVSGSTVWTINSQPSLPSLVWRSGLRERRARMAAVPSGLSVVSYANAAPPRLRVVAGMAIPASATVTLRVRSLRLREGERRRHGFSARVVKQFFEVQRFRNGAGWMTLYRSEDGRVRKGAYVAFKDAVIDARLLSGGNDSCGVRLAFLRRGDTGIEVICYVSLDVNEVAEHCRDGRSICKSMDGEFGDQVGLGNVILKRGIPQPRDADEKPPHREPWNSQDRRGGSSCGGLLVEVRADHFRNGKYVSSLAAVAGPPRRVSVCCLIQTT